MKISKLIKILQQEIAKPSGDREVFCYAKGGDLQPVQGADIAMGIRGKKEFENFYITASHLRIAYGKYGSGPV